MALPTTSRREVTEKLVSSIWKSQIFRREPLVSDWGQGIQVVYPGRPSADHGPDFRDAIIAFDNDLRRGDVEVHCTATDWQAHGHHKDPHYSRVILHVVFDEGFGPAIVGADGQSIPTLAVRPLLALSLPEIQDYLDTHQPSSPCTREAQRSSELTKSLLERAGEERLLSRAATVEGALSIDGPAQVLYEMLFEALGYSKNKMPCRELATNVPFGLLENIALATPPEPRRETLQALLLGAAGLLPSQRGWAADKGGESEYVRRLEARWIDLADYLGGLQVARRWHFSRVRPENFPTRRIVAASELFGSCMDAGLVETFVGLFRERPVEAIPRAVIRLLCTPASDAYWLRRFDFGGRETGRESLLIGRERAAVMAVNAVIPFVLALGRHTSDDALCSRAMESYRRFPPSRGNELTRYVAGLLGVRSGGRPLNSARVQQGLLHVYHNWCIDKNCAHCLAK